MQQQASGAWMPPVEAPIRDDFDAAQHARWRAGAGGPRYERRAWGRHDRPPRRLRTGGDSFSSRISENRPAKSPILGFTSVSAAPSASASIVAAAPSPQDEETTRILAPAPAFDQRRKARSDHRQPGIWMSSRITIDPGDRAERPVARLDMRQPRPATREPAAMFRSPGS